MTKSGLADSPFFAAPVNQAITPLPPAETEKQIIPVKAKTTSDFPTQVEKNDSRIEVQPSENQDQKRSFERTLEGSNERSIERLNERPVKPKREKIRHTFDIYKDQLIELQRIQWERVQAGKKKPKLGKMVSEGIDLYINQQASRTKRA